MPTCNRIASSSSTMLLLAARRNAKFKCWIWFCNTGDKIDFKMMFRHGPVWEKIKVRFRILPVLLMVAWTSLFFWLNRTVLDSSLKRTSSMLNPSLDDRYTLVETRFVSRADAKQLNATLLAIWWLLQTLLWKPPHSVFSRLIFRLRRQTLCVRHARMLCRHLIRPVIPIACRLVFKLYLPIQSQVFHAIFALRGEPLL